MRKSRTQSFFSVRLEMGPAFVCRGSPKRNRHAPVASAGTGDVLARKTHAKSPSSGCLKIMPKSDVRGRPRRNRNSPAAGNATGDFSEEVPRGIAILRSQRKFSGRSERRPESIFGGSPKRNCDSPVVTPFGDYNIKRDDRRTGESRFRLILPSKKLSGRPSERPENLSRDRRMAISRGTSS